VPVGQEVENPKIVHDVPNVGGDVGGDTGPCGTERLKAFSVEALTVKVPEFPVSFATALFEVTVSDVDWAS
jgi:hypothetical protein